MDRTLAAAFGVAGNQIYTVLRELTEAYDTMKKAGLQLTPDDKYQFDKYVKQVLELARFLNITELMAAIDKSTETGTE